MGEASRRKWRNRYVRRAVSLIKQGSEALEAYRRAWQDLTQHRAVLETHRTVLWIVEAAGRPELAREAARRLRVFKAGVRREGGGA